jgi:hypothetical protein
VDETREGDRRASAGRASRWSLYEYRSFTGLAADAIAVFLYACGSSIIARLIFDLVGIDGTLRIVLGVVVLVSAIVAGVQERRSRARRWKASAEQ